MDNISSIAIENITCDITVEYKSEIGLLEYFFLVISFMVFFVGVLSNTCLVYLVISSPKMRTVPNIFITNLAAGDIIFLLFHVPAMAPSHIQSQWHAGLEVCKAVHCVRFTTLGVSVFTLVVLAIDRYRAITRPIRSSYRNRLHGISCAVITLVFIWVTAIVLSLPITLNAFVKTFIVEVYNTTEGQPQTCSFMKVCSPFSQEDKQFIAFIVWFKFIVYFAVPCFIFAVFYGLMAGFLYRSSYALPVDGACTLHQQRHLATRRKLAKIVLGLVCVFVVCWLPEQTHMLQWFLMGISYQSWKIIAKLLTSLYACINPITLCILSHGFRKSYYRLICCVCIRVRNQATGEAGIPLNIRPSQSSQSRSHCSRRQISLKGNCNNVGAPLTTEKTYMIRN